MQTNIRTSDPIAGAQLAAIGTSGVSWGAIIAGAAAAAALSLALFILGTGFNLAIASPWSDRGADASTVGITSIAWMLGTQLAASALGGYLAGRLRVKWPDVQTDEVFFRDTAHGMLTWAVASLFTAAVLGGALSHVLGTGAQVAGTAVATGGVAAAQVAANPDAQNAAAGAASGASTQREGASAGGGSDVGSSGVMDYFVGGLFRSEQPAPQPAGNEAAINAEAATVLAYSLHAGQLSPDDKTHLGRLISQRTGLDQAAAEQRVTEIYYRASTELANAEAAAKGAADKARKTTAHISLWFFIALLGGAFLASFFATIGGRQRDTWGG